VTTKSNISPTEVPWMVPEGDRPIEDDLVAALHCSPVFARLLVNRGVRGSAEAASFLAISLADLVPPEAFAAMPRAVERIRRALRNKEKIAIFGDYDVDGVSGTAILLLFARQLEANVEAFLPHRVEDGYGLSRQAVDRMHASGARLVITVDNGINSADAIAYGRSRGLDFVITDHHEVAGTAPEGFPILNPKLPGEPYPFRDLAGAGVAFKLAWGLAREISGQKKVTHEFRQFLLKALALACLGTIADVVPLVGENRILVHHGLRLFDELDAPGFKALRLAACKDASSLQAHHVAFRLAPRLNAAGRMGYADRALELLITKDGERARALVDELDRENDRRRRLESRILKQAREGAEEARRRNDPCIVLACDDWHIGVLGIAAARLAEEYGRPAILIALEGERGRGSGRSAGGIPLHQTIEACRHLLEDFGGHAEACGVQIKAENVSAFAATLSDAIRSRAPPASPPLVADMVLPPHELTGQLLGEIERLAPFGQGNERPVFVAEDVSVLGEARPMGRTGGHLSFLCRSGPYTFRSVYFGGIGARERITERVTFAYEPYVNSFHGVDGIELRVTQVL
jgi:single-stranded-DNA-specific exonuclease